MTSRKQIVSDTEAALVAAEAALALDLAEDERLSCYDSKWEDRAERRNAVWAVYDGARDAANAEFNARLAANAASRKAALEDKPE